MCVVKKPTIIDYFSTDAVLHSSFPSVIRFSRDRFKAILRYLHVNDNANHVHRDDPNHDPMFKILPVFDGLIRRFGELYSPGCKLTLDEAICPFRGRVAFRVYMKNKPSKYGMRVECVCEASTGYVCNMELYTATGDNTIETLVPRVLHPFEGINHHVFQETA